jgi:hypothetical protein
MKEPVGNNGGNKVVIDFLQGVDFDNASSDAFAISIVLSFRIYFNVFMGTRPGLRQMINLQINSAEKSIPKAKKTGIAIRSEA